MSEIGPVVAEQWDHDAAERGEGPKRMALRVRNRCAAGSPSDGEGAGMVIDLALFEGHTAGPWAVEDPEFPDEGFKILFGTRLLNGMPGDGGYRGQLAVHEEIVVGDGIERCENECGDCTSCREFAEVKANALLIAAAPDLAVEVKRLREALADIIACNDGLEEARDIAMDAFGVRRLTPEEQSRAREIARNALRPEVSANG